MIDSIQLSNLRAFVLIVQLGNFSRAAEALGVSRSHVSRQISQLEKTLGITLFLRTTRSLKLTEAAQTLYRDCERAFSLLDLSLKNSVDTLDTMAGKIRINCVGGPLGETVIAPLITQFMVENPNIEIELDFSSHHVDLLVETFDLVLRMGDLPDGRLIGQKLFDVHMSTLASPQYLQAQGHPKHPSDLQRHRCLVGSVNKWKFTHINNQNECSVTVSPYLSCKNGHVMVQGAKNHLGLIRVPTLYCQNEIEYNELIEVFDEWHIPSVAFSMLYHRDKHQPMRLKSLISHLKCSLNGASNK